MRSRVKDMFKDMAVIQMHVVIHKWAVETGKVVHPWNSSLKCVDVCEH